MSVHSTDLVDQGEFSLDSQKSFWEVHQYKRTVRRLDDGYEMCNKLALLLQERAEIEKKYAKSLKAWSQKWNLVIEKGPEYGTNKSAWKSTLTEADRRHDVHRDICTRLNNEVVVGIKAWQKENYHKKMMNGFKETIELEEGFRKAQKQWANLLKKMQASQKHYYACCKAEKAAELQEKAAEGDSTLSPDQFRKIQDKRDKSTQDTIKAKDKYETCLEDINEHNPRYIEDMTTQFKKAQEYERGRLKFFKETLTAAHKVLDLSNSDIFSEIYADFSNSLRSSDSEKDLKWWSANHGVNMSMNWPVFEEYSEQVHAITKKSSKGHVGGTGGDGVVVASYKSTSDQDHNDTTQNSSAGHRWSSSQNSYGGWDSSPSVESKYLKRGPTMLLKVRPTVRPGKPNAAPRRAIDRHLKPKAIPRRRPTRDYVNYSAIRKHHAEHLKVYYEDDDEGENYMNHAAIRQQQREQGYYDGPASPEEERNDFAYDAEEDNNTGVQVKALYDYEGVEADELTFLTGDIFVKLEDEDEQGWCKGKVNGRTGLYPANYAAPI